MVTEGLSKEVTTELRTVGVEGASHVQTAKTASTKALRQHALSSFEGLLPGNK